MSRIACIIANCCGCNLRAGSKCSQRVKRTAHLEEVSDEEVADTGSVAANSGCGAVAERVRAVAGERFHEHRSG